VLNRLVGEEIAIVTPIAGTTRDPVRAHIAIAGVPFHLVDTAGLRQTDDPIEAMGMARTRDELARASMVLVLSAWGEAETCVPLDVPARAATVRVVNKTDRASAPLTDGAATLDLATDAVYVSALTGEGFDGLRQRLLALAGARTTEEGVFMARQRHLDALALCSAHVTAAQEKLTIAHELVAEDLRMAHRALQEITGEFSPDDLLGEIFGRFCIGK
jgi:tRNA modification GTPase